MVIRGKEILTLETPVSDWIISTPHLNRETPLLGTGESNDTLLQGNQIASLGEEGSKLIKKLAFRVMSLYV